MKQRFLSAFFLPVILFTALFFYTACMQDTKQKDGQIQQHILEKDGIRIVINYPLEPVPFGSDYVLNLEYTLPENMILNIPVVETKRNDLIVDSIQIEEHKGNIRFITYSDGNFTIPPIVCVVTSIQNGDIININSPSISFTVTPPVLEIAENEAPSYEALMDSKSNSNTPVLVAIISGAAILFIVLIITAIGFYRKLNPKKTQVPDFLTLLKLKCEQFERNYYLAENADAASITERVGFLLDIISFYQNHEQPRDNRIEKIFRELTEMRYSKNSEYINTSLSAAEKKFRDSYTEFKNIALYASTETAVKNREAE